ncbi:SDR family oxidoreductase [Nocardia sp. BMG111209]|uniref:SDR family oxidoreductase n=1 Tax=Nocardia sp. BMG111209 TaxID=1160137 RepID=UPI0003803872|nr:SDR family oxidoreductase [Nocardia sp. BMG111209]
MTENRRVVLVTGGSAGIGRAAVRRFAADGAAVAVLARGRAGVDAAVDEVRATGAEALPLYVDVADFEAVAAAADRAEAELGPIDVWVNSAFASVFAPFAQISAAEFRRVTEVTYLGAVHGTMAALSRMRPRGHGVVVQVGSALGERAIPLQSAYCGAKHAINGFLEAVRVELLHEHSGVHVTIVQAPATNTPQFSWVLSRLPRHPQPVPPIYQPEVVADTIVFAAAHPCRKQYWVGASTVGTIVGQRLVPALLDRYLARTGYDSQQTGDRAGDRPSNLWEPVDDAGPDFGAHGSFDTRAHRHSPQAWLARQVESAARAVRELGSGPRHDGQPAAAAVDPSRARSSSR